MTSLVSTYVGQSVASKDVWLNLWQPELSSAVQAAGTADVWQMWAMVQAGISSRLYKAPVCPVEISAEGLVTVALDFFVFPSDMGLNYTLTPSIGTISGGVMETVTREFDLVFDYTDQYDLEFLCETVKSAFETAAYNEIGDSIATPEVSVSGNVVSLSESCWCVVRVKCSALGYRHTAIMELQKYEQVEDEDGELNWTGYAIENIANTIQATWLDKGKLQSDSIDLDIPQCVQDYLAACDDGTIKSMLTGLYPVHYLVWYSTCSGAVLLVRSAWGDDDE